MFSPIALFVYNRPDHTAKTLEALSKNRLINESELYIFCDGPKSDSVEELNKINQVRAIVGSFSNAAKIHIHTYQTNQGLANNILNGVSEVIAIHKKVIVLEDDIITSPGFLKYMNDALDIYQNEDKVMHVAGYFPKVKTKLPSTFFYNVSSCWGWATWERAWKLINTNTHELIRQLNDCASFDLYKFNGGQQNHYYNQLVQNLSGQKKTWAIKWHTSIYLNRGFCLHPYPSLVENIGHDNTGENSGKDNPFQNTEKADFIPVEKIPIVENTNAIKAAESVYCLKLSDKIKNMIPAYIKERIKILSDSKLRKDYLEKRELYRRPRYLKGSSFLIDDNEFFFTDAATFLHGFEEIFENQIYKFEIKKANPIIIDCGSNIGLSIVYFKKIFPNSKIIAFEPDNDIFKVLQKNVESFRLKDVELNNKAIWIHNNGVEFKSEGGFSGRIPKEGDHKNQIIRVESIRLDRLLGEYDQIDFLKMDIEGAEYDVLKDSLENLKKIKYLFVEYHSHISESQKLHDILQLISQSGFRYHIHEAYSRKTPFINKTTMDNMDLQLNIYAINENI